MECSSGFGVDLYGFYLVSVASPKSGLVTSLLVFFGDGFQATKGTPRNDLRCYKTVRLHRPSELSLMIRAE